MRSGLRMPNKPARRCAPCSADAVIQSSRMPESRTILADDAGPLPGEVRPASYEEPVGGTVLR